MCKIALKFLLIFCLIFPQISFAKEGSGLMLIRDSETEDFLQDLNRPIFKAAGLNPDDIKFYIVNDSSLNAFVAGGQNIFIHTGLITRYDKPEVLAGVMAHETGHIAAGHLARSSEDMKNASNALLLTYIAGIAAAVGSSPDAGMAMILGGSQAAQRVALKYNRDHEEAADKLALQYLEKINYPENGLLELLSFFNTEETLSGQIIDEYAMTHPVSKKRIEFIKANLKNIDNKKLSQKFSARLQRIIVKLDSFLGDPDKILKKYANGPDVDLAHYAKSIAYFRKGKIKDAVSEIDYLINKTPNDGYLWELKGQILFESGNIQDAIMAYKNAVEFNSKNNLAKISLASAVIALNSGDSELTDFAIKNLEQTLPEEKSDPNIFKQLSAAYSQKKDEGRAYLALAEFNLLRADSAKAIKYAKLAKEKLDKNNKADLTRAEDITEVAKKMKDSK